MYFEDESGCYSLGRLRILKSQSPSIDEQSAALRANQDDPPLLNQRDQLAERKRTDRIRKEGCYVCMDAIEDMLVARGKIVTCLDIMRDKDKTGYLSALILVPAEDVPGAFRRIGFSTMTIEFFEDSQLTDITIV